MESSGYFVYDEQYSRTDSMEKYRALLKDSKMGNFVESILDDLSEEALIAFFARSVPRFHVRGQIYITTNGFHYQSVLRKASRILRMRIRKRRCLFYIEKDLAHRIRDAHKENELDMAKRMIKYMFLHNETNLNRLGMTSESMRELISGKGEKEVV